MEKSEIKFKVSLRAVAVPVLITINLIPFLLKKKMIFPRWLIKFERVQ